MAENKLDKTGLTLFWNYAVSYITANFSLIGTTAMGTVANTITGAIKEIVDKIGSVSMGTTATTVTGAIAEHEQDIDTIVTAIGNTTMGTTADTITGAIAEHEDDITNLNSKISYSTSTTITASSGVSTRDYIAYRFGRILVFHFQFDITTAKVNGDNVFTGIPSGFRPLCDFYGFVQKGTNTPCIIGVHDGGSVKAAGAGLPVGNWYTGTIVAISND